MWQTTHFACTMCFARRISKMKKTTTKSTQQQQTERITNLDIWFNQPWMHITAKELLKANNFRQRKLLTRPDSIQALSLMLSGSKRHFCCCCSFFRPAAVSKLINIQNTNTDLMIFIDYFLCSQTRILFDIIISIYFSFYFLFLCKFLFSVSNSKKIICIKNLNLFSLNECFIQK